MCVLRSRLALRSRSRPTSVTYRLRPPHTVTMAAKLVLLFAALALTQGALVRRDAPAPPSVTTNLNDFQKTFNEQWGLLVNSKNTQEVNKVLKEGTESVLQQLNVLASSLQTALTEASGKTKEALEQAKVNIESTVQDLQKSHPEIEQQTIAIKDKLQTAVQNTVQVTDKLAKDIAKNAQETNEKLAPKVKEAFELFVTNAQEIEKKLHETSNKQ